MITLSSILPASINKFSSSVGVCCSVDKKKCISKSILWIKNESFFTKSFKNNNVPMIPNKIKSSTLKVVKPNSRIFKPPIIWGQRWKYSPIKYLDDILKEQFPLKTMYRADVITGTRYLFDDLNEQMDLPCFLRTFNMPDNMASWIKVCELHLCLICSQFRPEEYLGKAAIEYLMEEYQNNIEYRSRRLAPGTALYTKEQLRTYKLHRKYIFLAYDEGIQENDMVLANIIWRRFFSSKCDDFTMVERLVKYIRVQLTHLHTIQFKSFIFERQQLVVPLSEVELIKSIEARPQKPIKPEKRKLYSTSLKS